VVNFNVYDSCISSLFLFLSNNLGDSMLYHKLWPFIYYLNYFITTIYTENVANGNYLGRKRLNFLLFRCKIRYFCYDHTPRLEYTTVLYIDNEFIDSLRVNTSFKKSIDAIFAQRSIMIIRRFLQLHFQSSNIERDGYRCQYHVLDSNLQKKINI